MISYRVHLTPDDNDTLLVTSPDFPELVSFGDDRDDALANALGAFEEAIEARMSEREDIPTPSAGRGDRVALPVQSALKVLLYQQMLRQDVRKAELARRMGLHKQEVDRILTLNHATSLTKLERAFAALGKQVDVSIRRLAAAE
ncbi:MAG: type II toxin-antitoxin system HicB family antitoxin [Parvibaculaceae bacterium]